LTNWWLSCLREEIVWGKTIEHKKCKDTDKIPKEMLHKIFYLSVSFPVSTGYWFLFAIVAGVLRRQKFNSSAS
jgi:hypothetical protein